jgi:hypothetical protein
MPFIDRTDAGRQLAKALARYKNQRPVVLALPRGGVPVAAEVATALDAPLDLILVRKIGVPSQPELAMGAVVDGGHEIVVRNGRHATGITGGIPDVCPTSLLESAPPAVISVMSASIYRSSQLSSMTQGDVRAAQRNTSRGPQNSFESRWLRPIRPRNCVPRSMISCLHHTVFGRLDCSPTFRKWPIEVIEHLLDFPPNRARRRSRSPDIPALRRTDFMTQSEVWTS